MKLKITVTLIIIAIQFIMWAQIKNHAHEQAAIDLPLSGEQAVRAYSDLVWGGV